MEAMMEHGLELFKIHPKGPKCFFFRLNNQFVLSFIKIDINYCNGLIKIFVLIGFKKWMCDRSFYFFFKLFFLLEMLMKICKNYFCVNLSFFSFKLDISHCWYQLIVIECDLSILTIKCYFKISILCFSEIPFSISIFFIHYCSTFSFER